MGDGRVENGVRLGGRTVVVDKVCDADAEEG